VGAIQGFNWQDRPDLANAPLTVSHFPNVVNGAADTQTTGNNSWRIVTSRFVSGGNDFLSVNGLLEITGVNGGLLIFAQNFVLVEQFNGSAGLTENSQASNHHGK
jgi:hypothetical protein